MGQCEAKGHRANRLMALLGSAALMINAAPGLAAQQADQDGLDGEAAEQGDSAEASAREAEADEGRSLPLETLDVYGIRSGRYGVSDAGTALLTQSAILDTPASIQVIPEALIEDQAAFTIDQALRNVSGVNFINGGEGSQLFSRGFGAQLLRDGFLRTEFTDGDVNAADLNTANIERIEVLKGPASVIFGRSNAGGLVNLVTKRPVGSLGLAFFIVTGLWLWWPGIKCFARGFRLRFTAGLDIALRDSHRVLGAVALIILFLPVVSGAFIVFPEAMEPPVKALFATADPVPAPPVRADGRLPVPADQASAAAQAAVPGAQVTGFFLPGGPEGYFSFRFRREGEPHQHYTNGRLEVLVNPYDLNQVQVRDEADWPLGTRMTRVWMFPTHTGEIFGLPGRWLIFLSGLVPPILYITGLLTWARRSLRKKRRARLAKSVAVG